MKFLDINGVTTLWNKIGIKTFYKKVLSEQAFNTAENDTEALNALYDDLVQLVSKETISSFDKNKINIIVLRGEDPKNVIAKIIILQIIDRESESTILGFTSLVYGQYSRKNIYYSEIGIGKDYFYFTPVGDPNSVIER